MNGLKVSKPSNIGIKIVDDFRKRRMHQVQFLNRWDSTRRVSAILFGGVVLGILGKTQSDSLATVLIGISLMTLFVGASLGLRGLARRISVLNLSVSKLSRELQEKNSIKAPSGGSASPTIETPQSARNNLKHNPGKESASKAHESYSNPKGKLIQIPASVPAKIVPPAATFYRGEAEKKWQLDKRLILPYSARLNDFDFVSDKYRFANNIRVAAILDPFSYGSLSPEMDIRPITPENWREEFEEFRPEIFLCESAWQGVPAQSSPWKGRVYASVRFGYENRKDLLEILKYCKASNIPTVFWNKEDPTHFDDRVNDFVDTARMFDFVFTTAEELVPSYNRLLDRTASRCMPFGVQPRIFNPGLDRAHSNKNGVVFAGSWYKMHEERKVVQSHILDQSLEAGLDLVIHDRYANIDNEHFGFPEKYKPYIKPAVPFERTAQLYREFEFGISINTVTNSNSMLARRAFEMAAAGCGIITNPTSAISRFFGDSVLSLDLESKILPGQLEELSAKKLGLMNEVLSMHSYEKRVEDLLGFIGKEALGITTKIAVVVRVKDLQEVGAAQTSFKKLLPKAQQLILLVDKHVPSHEVQEFYKKGINASTVVVSERYWAEQGVDPQTLFDFPLVYFASTPWEFKSIQDVSRAVAHAVYAESPVGVGEQAQWPSSEFGCFEEDCVIRAKDFVYSIESGTTEGLITRV